MSRKISDYKYLNQEVISDFKCNQDTTMIERYTYYTDTFMDITWEREDYNYSLKSLNKFIGYPLSSFLVVKNKQIAISKHCRY